MPSNILAADTNFPNLTDDQSTDEKFGVITNYLYMLLEQLRYTLENLGVENFNGKELDDLINLITEPVYIQLQDLEGNLASVTIEADNITSRLQDAEGNISVLQQTSNSILSTVSTLEGDISTLQQTAYSLTSKIQDAEGNISTLQQTVNGISLQVSSVAGSVSSISQTVNSITLSVANGTDQSIISLNRNGVAVSSQSIRFSGVVTFTNLATQGQTVINGGNIAAGGTISGVTVQSMSGTDSGFEVCYGTKYSYTLVGGMKYDSNGSGTSTEARDRTFIYTQPGWAMKLESGAATSISAAGLVYIRGEGGITIDGQGTTINLNGPININGIPLDTYIQTIA